MTGLSHARYVQMSYQRHRDPSPPHRSNNPGGATGGIPDFVGAGPSAADRAAVFCGTRGALAVGASLPVTAVSPGEHAGPLRGVFESAIGQRHR